MIARFTVNDIITGWVEILSARQRMESMTLSLVREELYFFYGGSVGREGDEQTRMAGGSVRRAVTGC